MPRTPTGKLVSEIPLAWNSSETHIRGLDERITALEHELEQARQERRRASAVRAARLERRRGTAKLRLAGPALGPAEDDVDPADGFKGRFLSVVSHELRTPLNSIMGFASILEDELDGPLTPAQQTHVGKILRGADRLLALVDDLLDAARIQAGTLNLAIHPTPVDPVVEEAFMRVAGRIEAKGQELLVDQHVAGLPTFDGVRVAQVLAILLDNASKLTPAGGRIALAARRQDGAVVFEVADTGPGIDPADVPRLFRRFEQLDMSNTRVVEGTGLGLAIARAIVEGHGGWIGVESEPGAGSTFRVVLPDGERRELH